MNYQPVNLGRWIIWGGAALLFIAAPHVFKGGFALTMLIQMGTLTIFALARIFSSDSRSVSGMPLSSADVAPAATTA